MSEAGQDSIRDERRQQFFIVDNTVIDHYAATIGVNGLAVYAVLVRMTRDGTCYPSIPTIAKKLGIADNTVKGALAKLEKAGLLEIEHRTTITPNKKVRHHSNVYVLSNPQNPASENDPPGSKSEGRGSNHDLPPGSNIDAPGSTDDLPLGQNLTPNNTKEKKTNETRRSGEEDDGARKSPPAKTSSPSPSSELVHELEKTINIYGGGVTLIVRDFAEKLDALGESIIDTGVKWRQDNPTKKLASFERWLAIRITELETKAHARAAQSNSTRRLKRVTSPKQVATATTPPSRDGPVIEATGPPQAYHRLKTSYLISREGEKHDTFTGQRVAAAVQPGSRGGIHRRDAC